jgi:poly-beta-1,6-N-acetyl-D-glucosamine synthase
MIKDYLYLLTDLINAGILVFAVILFSSYLVLAFISLYASAAYIRKNRYTNYSSILSSPYAPSVSLIAPAYNESATIIENVRSLLSIHYNNFQVIIINDGSTDNSLELLQKVYELEKVNFHIDEQLKTKAVKGVYRSKKAVYHNLLIVDKVNGGKADALNVGLNIAQNKYVACIDVDCVLEQDALLKLVKPFMDEGKKKVIATGGVIRIANSCQIVDGKLVEINFPEKFLPKVQALEYIRAFLLGRMAWAKLDGLLIISGAFGMFDKKIAIAAGGYNHKTVGEDMELIVRMRRYMHDIKQAYSVAYIPDPLCWTEAPETYKILGRQRNRWTRGTIETLFLHRKMFLNPRYGSIGMLSYPFWVFFEWLAPIVEVIGIVYFVFLACLGMANWTFFLSLLFSVYCFAVMFSTMAILIEEFTFHRYRKKREILKLFQTALLEPIIFHPFVLFTAIRGNIDIIRGKKNWGVMTRVGFTTASSQK